MMVVFSTSLIVLKADASPSVNLAISKNVTLGKSASTAYTLALTSSNIIRSPILTVEDPFG